MPGTESTNLQVINRGSASEGNIKMLNDIPDRLPIWNWSDNSCSLDTSLTIMLCFVCRSPKSTLNWVRACERSNPYLDALTNYVASWSKDNTQWENWNEGALTKARDTIRAMIESDKSSIGINSSADDVILKLAPSPLIQTDLAFDITCGRCDQNFQSHGKYMILMFDGFAQANSNSQALVDHMVCAIVFRELTCDRERHYIDILFPGPVPPVPIARAGPKPNLTPTRPGSLHIPRCCSCQRYTHIAPLNRVPDSIDWPGTNSSIRLKMSISIWQRKMTWQGRATLRQNLSNA